VERGLQVVGDLLMRSSIVLDPRRPMPCRALPASPRPGSPRAVDRWRSTVTAGVGSDDGIADVTSPVTGERAGPPPAPRPLTSYRATALRITLQTASVLACLGATFALIRLAGAVLDAHAYTTGSTSVSQMTVTYAGLDAVLAPSHPGTRAPQRLCLVALADGGAQDGAILDGRACSALHAGDRPLVTPREA